MKRVWAFYVVLPVLLITGSLLFGFAGHTAAAPGANTVPGPVRFAASPDAPDPNETLRLVNRERAENGLGELEADEKLGRLAAARAADMAAQQYYAHKNPDGRYYFDYFDAYGVNAGYSCENLDLVFVPEQTMVIHEWMASLNGHRGCLLHDKVIRAGYAAAKITLRQFDGSETTAYLVVAIHADIH